MNSTIDVLFPPFAFLAGSGLRGGAGRLRRDHAGLCVRKRRSSLVPSRSGPPSRFSWGSRRWNLVEFRSSFLTDPELRKKGDVVLICNQVALIDFVRLENWPLFYQAGVVEAFVKRVLSCYHPKAVM